MMEEYSPLDLLHFSDGEDDDSFSLPPRLTRYSENEQQKTFTETFMFNRDVDDHRLEDGSYRFITRGTMFHQHFPDQIKDIQATAEDKKRMPNLLFWRQYGCYEPEPVCGPQITAKEEWTLMMERIDKKQKREHLSQTKREIKEGKQPKLTTFFQKSRRSNHAKQQIKKRAS